MALSTGSRVGVFEIAEQIGAGGMGEVFRAVDTVLNRTVAIKVLPSSLAHDTDRLARFEREAHTLAVLNHPNIAQVYGFEKGDTPALVMEFVEGPTLADRIGGMPMPVDEVVSIAAQIADALESAHDHGIIHRDLKPANIKVRPDGAVKVLDFGLAKAVVPDSASTSMANSPTITTPAMTHAGVVLGTAAYMSPEQAKGRVVDRRADIWAFGCVLFEMLTGRRAFSGDDVSDVMVAILRDEPKWDLLPASTPSHVRSLLRRCLQRDPRKRLPHLGVARLELTEPPPTAEASSSPVRSVVIGGAVAAIVLAIGVSAAVMWPRSPRTDATSLTVKIDLGTNRPVELRGTVAISPDGTTLAFVGRSAGVSVGSAGHIFVRRLNDLDASELNGTEGATTPFFSPDGKWIGFFDSSAGQMRKVAVTGGPMTVICDTPPTRGGSWGDDGLIVFATASGLMRVPAAGGASERISTVQPGSPVPFWPQVLRGARHVLYAETISSDPSTGTIVLRQLSDGTTTALVQGRYPRYASGVLTFFRGGRMYAVAVDAKTLQPLGAPEPVTDDVAQTSVGLIPIVAVSDGGTLVYSQSAGAGGGAPTPIMWLSQTGPLTPLRPTAASWMFPRFSPDGNRIAMSISDGHQADIWVYDFGRDVMTRVTTDPASDFAPVWTADGRGLVFGSQRGSLGASNLFWQRADGTGMARRLTQASVSQLPGGFDPAGRRLILHQGDPAVSRQSLAVLAVEPDGEGLKAGELTEFVGGPFLKANPRISPDGKWVAYVATDSGNYELYVQPFVAGAARVQVSSGGAGVPAWSPTKNELYYTGPSGLLVVPFSVKGDRFVPEKPRTWTTTLFSATPPIRTYGPGVDFHPDGARFAVAPPESPAGETVRGGQLVLMFNGLMR